MELKDRLKLARKEAGLTQTELAERVGIKQASVSEIERGVTHSSTHVMTMAVVCGVDPFWLAYGEGSPRLQKLVEAKMIKTEPPDETTRSLPDTAAYAEEGFCEIPYLSKVSRVGGGLPLLTFVEGKALRLSSQVFESAGVEPRAAACSVLKQSNMEDLIKSQSLFAYDSDFIEVLDGEIYAYDHLGTQRVSYLYNTPAGGVRLRHANSSAYPDEPLTARDFTDDIVILGRVFWWMTVRKPRVG